MLPGEELDELMRREVLRVWGFAELRPLQARAIRAGVEGRDALTVLPTGGGKSLCYQVPPLVTGKPTLVISPLIALMRDQVRGLELSGYDAAALHSALTYDEARNVEARFASGETKLLFAAPERVVTPAFGALLAGLADRGRLGAIAIDEAHCISQWGHDFRPEYRQLATLRAVAPGVGMQSFTATATRRVRHDIVEQLGLQEPEMLVGVFDRPNLSYRVRPRRRCAEQCAAAINDMNARGESGGAIIYCLSRKNTEQLAAELRAMGLDADAYHAGMDKQPRQAVEERFTNEELDVVVATVAFGMGIDRSNVRLVVHACMPKSIEAYQQETGRAGRDGLPAECLLLYGPGDAPKWAELMARNAPDPDATPAAAQVQLELLGEMQRFATSLVCRHKQLSEHFGQRYERDSCGACDVCLGETRGESDSTRIAQILMSCVARTGQRFGASHIADVARGAETERVTSRGHHELKVFGMLRDRAKREIRSMLDQLVAAGALEHGEFRSLRFGPRGSAIMKAEETVQLARPLGGTDRPRRSRGPSADLRPLAPHEHDLFETLRALRKRFAEERAVPPYVVFSDATLRELCRLRPRTRSAMLDIKGIGQRRLDDFGQDFLEAIERFDTSRG